MPAESPGDGRLKLSPEPAAIAASGTVKSISLNAASSGLSVTDQIALQDADLRKWMVDRVVPAFLKANGMTLIALVILVVLDEINIASHLIAPGDRIITERVIMALLGSTTVQVGAIAALIARYLFPSRPVCTHRQLCAPTEAGAEEEGADRGDHRSSDRNRHQ